MLDFKVLILKKFLSSWYTRSQPILHRLTGYQNRKACSQISKAFGILLKSEQVKCGRSAPGCEGSNIRRALKRDNIEHLECNLLAGDVQFMASRFPLDREKKGKHKSGLTHKYTSTSVPHHNSSLPKDLEVPPYLPSASPKLSPSQLTTTHDSLSPDPENVCCTSRSEFIYFSTRAPIAPRTSVF